TRSSVAVLIVAALACFLSMGSALAQPPRRPSRLATLQRQNALQQQQNAMQTALQQTTALLQVANQQYAASQQLLSGMSAVTQSELSQQLGPPNMINFQLQQSGLQVAMQQTTALLQASFQRNGALGQTALRQMNTLQLVSQDTATLQTSLSLQNGQLT